MARRTPRQRRFLGLWTAGWLAVLLLVGLLVAGDVRVEWPVFAVPLLWALLAVRPRRGGYGGGYRRSADTPDGAPGFWDDPPGARAPGLPPSSAPPSSAPPSARPPAPPTREADALPPLPPRPGDRWGGGPGRDARRG